VRRCLRIGDPTKGYVNEAEKDDMSVVRRVLGQLALIGRARHAPKRVRRHKTSLFVLPLASPREVLLHITQHTTLESRRPKLTEFVRAQNHFLEHHFFVSRLLSST
jgi:hypothetical protein